MAFLYNEDYHNVDRSREMGVEDARLGKERRPICQCADCLEAYWEGYSSEMMKIRKENSDGEAHSA